ncbi:hypothetical protein BGY98DRAFT_949607 [Russula aff. rugulosa BPL654]|nr:hypothetical protein BGY98DRAFT_949607 [Russula aff. rugulosa BPL654]
MVSLSTVSISERGGASLCCQSVSFMPFPNEDNCFPRSIPRGLSPSQKRPIPSHPCQAAGLSGWCLRCRAPLCNPRTTKKVKTWQKEKDCIENRP